MKFVKPCHGDNPDLQVSEIKRSSFDPRLPEYRLKINPDHYQALLTDLQNPILNKGIQQFLVCFFLIQSICSLLWMPAFAITFCSRTKHGTDMTKMRNRLENGLKRTGEVTFPRQLHWGGSNYTLL